MQVLRKFKFVGVLNPARPVPVPSIVWEGRDEWGVKKQVAVTQKGTEMRGAKAVE